MLKKFSRLLKIIKTLIKYRLYKYSDLNSANTEQYAVNLRKALEELGPIFVKFGQLLSTRHELLPLYLINELSKLQDRVKPFPTVQARYIIQSELKKDCEQIFTEFDDEPLASASVAQVYQAKLDDNNVIIKILRPNLNTIIKTDLSLLKLLVKVASKLKPDIKRFKPNELVTELERVLDDEQDLLREAANCSQIRRNFKDSNILYIPKVYWKYCTKNILVLEKINGVSINNINYLKEQKVNLKLLARRGLEIFFIQVFEHCLFHGDLHPGNILVNIENPSDPSFYAVDFGIMGSLGPHEQYYLASNLHAFLNRDYRRVAQLHIESGWVDADTRIDLFESAIRTVSEPILELPVSEISFGELLVKLFDVAKSFNMQLQPQLLVFKKSLINVEGIAHKLDPDLDIWQASKPFIEKWAQDQYGMKSIYNKLIDSIPKWMAKPSELPEIFNVIINSKKSA